MSMENRFEQQARRILRFLKSDKRYDLSYMPRPFMVELTGSPSAGKTTTVIELDKFFLGVLLNCFCLRSVICHGFCCLNQVFLFRAHVHIIDVMVFDRCIFDAYSWMMYWAEKGKLSPEERAMIQAFFVSPFWTSMIDIAYFFVCDPEVAMERELRIALSQKTGETSNPKTIATLVERYKEAYRQLSPANPHIFLVDTTHLDEKTMVERIASQTLDVFEERARKATAASCSSQ
ncbi:MAG: hypothetical protein UZ00_C0001G0010 [Parcubacteria group bacterium GW2011_GWA1_60_11]|nr:MAG: hypothetical protein UZ00_C0001G0010 [Parcubacteria group bacterium GW2011_GWA1_60_11]